MAIRRRVSNKNPPIFSHEFVIQNHADILACFAMLIVTGVMFQVTSPLCSIFVTLRHNVTVPREGSEDLAPSPNDPVFYTVGLKDIPAIFFYWLVVMVVHQIIQEYVLDKFSRKLHLSKTKHSKFNESGQLLFFYLISIIWSVNILVEENYSSIQSLWVGYPHSLMTYFFKLFYIIQIAHWLHIYPEFYFQKIKKEEIWGRVVYATLYLIFIVAAYVFSYTRLGLCLLSLHYLPETLFHVGRLLSYFEKQEVAKILFRINDFLFVLVHIGTGALAVLTFWYGLPLSTAAEQQVIDRATGSFNTPAFRILALVSISLLQAWLLWNFITFHLRKRRENSSNNTTSGTRYFGFLFGGGGKVRKSHQDKSKSRKERIAKKEAGGEGDYENDAMTEVDQNTKSMLRHRSTKN